MFIRALTEYYDVLRRTSKIIGPEWSMVNITWIAYLRPDGTLADVKKCYDVMAPEPTDEDASSDSKKKKKRPNAFPLKFPLRYSLTKVNSEFIEHRADYLFGLVSNTNPDDPLCCNENTLRRHKECVEKNLEYISGLSSPVINAYRRFLETWDPEDNRTNEHLLSTGTGLKTNWAFCLIDTQDFLHEDPKITQRWEKIYSESKISDDAVIAQCSVTGEYLPIARIHRKTLGIGATSGSLFVSYSTDAMESYGKTQSYNSSISEDVMEKYTASLQYLVKSPEHHMHIGDLELLFWATCNSTSEADNYVIPLLTSEINTANVTAFLEDLFLAAKKGIPGYLPESMDPTVTYYIAGVKVNNTRLALQFFHQMSYGKMIDNVYQHMTDMMLSDSPSCPSIYKMTREMVSPKNSNDNISPVLTEQILSAILTGADYPVAMLTTVIKRITTDMYDNSTAIYTKLNTTRIGMLKAYINRHARKNGETEKVTMALNPESTNPAYVCGRLFRILEEIQLKSANYQLSRTFKETYFSAAVSRPASTFPVLFEMNVHHLSKLEHKDRYYKNTELAELISKLDESFPASLTPVEQGMFIIGYYQQMQDTYEKVRQAKAAGKDETLEV